jgi:hypothetical protein
VDCDVPGLDKRGVERARVAGGAADGLVGIGDTTEKIVVGTEGLVDSSGVVVRFHDSLGIVIKVLTTRARDDRTCRGEKGLCIKSCNGRDKTCRNLVVRERGSSVAIIRGIEGGGEGVVELNE